MRRRLQCSHRSRQQYLRVYSRRQELLQREEIFCLNFSRASTFMVFSMRQGDSGGPLSYINNGVYNQVGIVSFGSSNGCEIEVPAAFARVSSFATWIAGKTGLVF